MDEAYEYARAQLLGLQFAPFTLGTAGRRYVWSVPTWASAALAWLDSYWPAAAFAVFSRVVEVRPWQS